MLLEDRYLGVGKSRMVVQMGGHDRPDMAAARYLGVGQAAEEQDGGLWKLGIHPLCVVIPAHLVVMQAPAHVTAFFSRFG